MDYDISKGIDKEVTLSSTVMSIVPGTSVRPRRPSGQKGRPGSIIQAYRHMAPECLFKQILQRFIRADFVIETTEGI